MNAYLWMPQSKFCESKYTRNNIHVIAENTSISTVEDRRCWTTLLDLDTNKLSLSEK